MAPPEGVRIDALPVTTNPQRTHELPAMWEGITVRLSVAQMLGLGTKADVGLDQVDNTADADKPLEKLGVSRPPKEITTATYTLQPDDPGRTLYFNRPGSQTVTVPNLQVGAYVNWVQKGAGQVTFVGDTGVVVRSRNGVWSGGQYAMGTLAQENATDWYLGGDLTS